MKKLMLLIIPLLLLNCIYAVPPTIKSKAAIIINADTGQVLYQHNANTPLAPASTTKIMTALLILENGDLNASYTASDAFKNPGGSHIAIDHGETIGVKDLLYALLVESANDAAVVLAEGQAGSVDAFVDQMNEKANALGASFAHYVNPHGLDAAGHEMAASDLATIAAYAMQNPTFRDIVSTKRYTIAPTNKKNEARNYLRSRNLLMLDDGNQVVVNGKDTPIYDATVDGIKTGYTQNAGNCLVSSFSYNASRYIVVVMGAADKQALYGDSKMLIDYAKNAFKQVRIVSEGEVVTNIKVKNAEASGLNLVAEKTIERAIPTGASTEPTIERDIVLIEDLDIDILMGTQLGEAIYRIGNQEIARVNVLAQRDIDERDLVGEISHALTTKPMLDSPLDVAVLIGKFVLTLVIWRWLVMRIRRRRAKKRRDQRLAEIRSDMPHDAQQSNIVAINRQRKTKKK